MNTYKDLNMQTKQHKNIKIKFEKLTQNIETGT